MLAVGTATTRLKTRARLPEMAVAGPFDGDEAVARTVILASEDNVRAICSGASHTFAVDARLPLRTDHRLMNAAGGWIAAILGAWVAIIAVDFRPNAFATGTGIGTRTGVEIVAKSALVCRAGKARTVGRITSSQVACVIELRAVDYGTNTKTSGIAGISDRTPIAVIASVAGLRNGNARACRAGSDIALVGQLRAFAVEAAVAVDEVAMLSEMLLGRVRADGDDVVGIGRRAGEVANSDFGRRVSVAP